jgi:maleylacetate reductase
VIVRWGLDELAGLLGELGIERPLLVASARWDLLGLPAASRWSEIPSHRIDTPADVDGIVAVGGGSAIDTAKAASAASALPLVSVPTTYSGAEWTPSFGVRDPDKRMVGGGGGARLAAIVYDPTLTLDLDRQTTVGTAMNALAHCAEALYTRGRAPEGDGHALDGARLIAEFVPRVVDEPTNVDSRRWLLEGAAHAGEALGIAGLALGHAMAQAVGGAYGLPHGTLNGICLPAALRFNASIAAAAVRAFGEAIGAPDDPASRVEELTALGGPTRLRELGVPEEALGELAERAAGRRGNELNPRPATAAEIAELLHGVW